MLREHKISQSEYGIRNLIEFKSGAALITILEETSEKLKTKIPEMGLHLKQTQPRVVHTFRIHNIPADSQEDGVMEDMTLALGMTPIKVELVNYTNNKTKDSKLAVITCNLETLQVAENKNTILINYKCCHLDCNPQLMRCRLCTRYGHTRNHCPGPNEELTKMAKDQQYCLDCLHFNHDQKTAGLPRNRYRPCDHSAGTTLCPTWTSLKNKYLRTRVNPIGAQEVDEEQQNS